MKIQNVENGTNNITRMRDGLKYKEQFFSSFVSFTHVSDSYQSLFILIMIMSSFNNSGQNITINGNLLFIGQCLGDDFFGKRCNAVLKPLTPVTKHGTVFLSNCQTVESCLDSFIFWLICDFDKSLNAMLNHSKGVLDPIQVLINRGTVARTTLCWSHIRINALLLLTVAQHEIETHDDFVKERNHYNQRNHEDSPVLL